MLVINSVSATELKAIESTQISFILNNFKVIAESDNNHPDYARIIATTEPYECGGKWTSCPSSNLYIATSMLVLDPPQKTYMLPEAKGWKFVKWLEVKTGNNGMPVMGVEVHTTLNGSNITNRSEWKPKRYRVWFNTYGAQYETF